VRDDVLLISHPEFDARRAKEKTSVVRPTVTDLSVITCLVAAFQFGQVHQIAAIET
jgi:hypothetical protein